MQGIFFKKTITFKKKKKYGNKKKTRTQIKYQRDIFENLIENYQKQLNEIKKIQEATENFLNKRLENKKKSLNAKIDIIDQIIKIIGNLGFVNYSVIVGIFENNKKIKPAWVIQVFNDHNEIYKKKLNL